MESQHIISLIQTLLAFCLALVFLWILFKIAKYQIFKNGGNLKGSFDNKVLGNLNLEISNQSIERSDGQEINKDLELSQSNDSPFKFSKHLERFVRSVDGTDSRRIRFRIGIRDSGKEIYDIRLNAYLVLHKTYNYIGNAGYGSAWKDLSIRPFLPSLEGFWTLSHFIDDDSQTSPFLLIENETNLKRVEVRIYTSGYQDGVRVFGKVSYAWDQIGTKYGIFRLRQNETDPKLSIQQFDEIVPVGEDKGDWFF